MKNILFVLLIVFNPINSLAQNNAKPDSIYYLLDTGKTSSNDHMWAINTSGSFTYCALQCPCLKYNGKPTFFYSSGSSGRIVLKNELEATKFTNLSTLINKAKSYLSKDDDRENVQFFFIEFVDKKYVIHEVNVFNPEIHILSLPDVIVQQPDTTAFKEKGVLRVQAKDVIKNIGKSIITSGSIFNTKKSNSDGSLLLEVGIERSKKYFTIRIKKENLIKFDSAEIYYKGKQVKIIGKVIKNDGKPEIEIADPKQIQVIQIK
ncbi:MAG: hypothetical protein JWQ66_1828 [Mucilaginibacter sp.]|nr:hypothetical protein [Mucilaginibacter sp.]